MAEQGQEELPESVEENKRHRPKAVKGVMDALGIKKKKSSQSTPPPSGTTLAWTSQTEADTNIDDTSNTPLELTTFSQSRTSSHSRSGQRRKDSDTNRNTPPTVSCVPSYSVYYNTVQYYM